MSVLTEVTHSISPLTRKAFDAYVEIYCDEAIPAMQRHGYEILGGWKWSSGRLANDLMLIRFESQAEREKAEASLLGDAPLLDRLRGKLAKAGVQTGEEIKFAVALPHATEERLQLALKTSNAREPRQFWLTRTTIPLSAGPAVYPLLSQVADQVENRGTHKLVLAHSTTVGIRGEITQLWAGPTGDLHYQPDPDEPAVLTTLREAIPEETVILLNPLPYSRLQ